MKQADGNATGRGTTERRVQDNMFLSEVSSRRRRRWCLSVAAAAIYMHMNDDFRQP